MLPKYTAIKPTQIDIIAQPYLRAFVDINATDLASYQALVNVFTSEGVLKSRMDVSAIMLTKAEVGL